MLNNEKGQLAIIEIVLAVAILVVAAWFIYPRLIGKGTSISDKGDSVVKTRVVGPMQSAKGIECQSNLGQVRSTISSYVQSNEHYPASLADLGINSVTTCPVSKQPYTYDPAQGKVSCSTSGHERY